MQSGFKNILIRCNLSYSFYCTYIWKFILYLIGPAIFTVENIFYFTTKRLLLRIFKNVQPSIKEIFKKAFIRVSIKSDIEKIAQRIQLEYIQHKLLSNIHISKPYPSLQTMQIPQIQNFLEICLAKRMKLKKN